MVPASLLSSLNEDERDAILTRAVSVARSRSSTGFLRNTSSSSSSIPPSSPLSTTSSSSSLSSSSLSPSPMASSSSMPFHMLKSLPCSTCGRPSSVTCGKCYIYNYCGLDCLQIAWQGYVKCPKWGTESWCACTYCYGKSMGRSISTEPERLRRCHREVCSRLVQGVPANIRAKAGLGEANSLSIIGDYFRTRSGDPDFVKAAEFYKQAASIGDAKSMYYLGLFHRYGTGVKLDTQLTIHYWFKSAGKGANALAQYELGLAYLNGDILPTNLQEAHRWLTLALTSGSVDKESINAALALCKERNRLIDK